MFNTDNYTEQGGARAVVGGSLDVVSGGEIDIESGGALKVAGSDVTTPLGALAKTSSATVAADALAIPVTNRYVAKTTGADAEALTLANGVAGQRLTISLVTDGGGDGTLTPTTASGFVAIVFADAGDTATLEYVDDTVGWIIVGLAGVAAPPAITVA